jgi:hypothetical protein
MPFADRSLVSATVVCGRSRNVQIGDDRNHAMNRCCAFAPLSLNTFCHLTATNEHCRCATALEIHPIDWVT